MVGPNSKCGSIEGDLEIIIYILRYFFREARFFSRLEKKLEKFVLTAGEVFLWMLLTDKVSKKASVRASSGKL